MVAYAERKPIILYFKPILGGASRSLRFFVYNCKTAGESELNLFFLLLRAFHAHYNTGAHWALGTGQ